MDVNPPQGTEKNDCYLLRRMESRIESPTARRENLAHQLCVVEDTPIKNAEAKTLFTTCMPNRNGAIWLTLGAMFLALFGFGGKVHAQCSNPANPIVAENCLPGSPDSEWDVKTSDAGDPTIQGFSTDISVNQGSTVFFKINTPASALYDQHLSHGLLRWHGCAEGRYDFTLGTSPSDSTVLFDGLKLGLIDCGNWAVSASWQVPANATSGIYFAHLMRTDTGGDSHIIFIVRNDSSHSAILYQTSDETWQAYNYYGGGSLYGPASPTFDITARSNKVSYNRPFYTRSFGLESDTFLFGAEFAMVQWLETKRLRRVLFYRCRCCS